MSNYFVCTYGNFDKREERITKSLEENCYFLHEDARYPSAIDEIKAGDIVLLKDNAMIIAWGEAKNHPGTNSPIAHTGVDGWKHIINVEEWHKDTSAVHSYGLLCETLVGGCMSLVKKVTPRWALGKLALMKQIDALPFIEQDLFELSLDDIASWYHDNIYSDKGIFATVPILQRGLVWSAQQNELFWDSIMRKIPVGAILLCPMIFSQEKGNITATHHILDGQQRCNAIAKGFDCNPFEKEEAIIWLDIDPDKEQLKKTSRRYLVRVSTVAHPWGYEITDESGKAACLDTASIREALKKVLKDPNSSDGKKRVSPRQMYPKEANLPIPLGFLLHSFMQTENAKDFWAKVCDYIINNIPFDDLKGKLKASASSKELMFPLPIAGQGCPNGQIPLFRQFLLLQGLTFRFLRYIFHVPVSFGLIVDVVFIINHRNKLFSSPVFQNVRNFPDVISFFIFPQKIFSVFNNMTSNGVLSRGRTFFLQYFL